MADELTGRRDFLRGVASASAAGVALATQVAQAAEPLDGVTPGAAPGATPAPAEPTGHLITRPGSDFMVDVIKTLNLDYLAANPGSSFRSLHESVVNYGGNKAPELITCLHEESSVAIAHGYAKAAGKPMGVMAHGTVGLQHASMAIYNAWCDRVPLVIFAGNGIDASKRRPGTEWAHSVQDAALLVRDFVKWDDAPASLQHFAESTVRTYRVATTGQQGPVVDLGGRMNFPTTHHLNHSDRKRALVRDADVVLMLEVGDPWGQLNAVVEPARTTQSLSRPDVKVITLGFGESAIRSNYQDFQRFLSVELAIHGEAQASMSLLTEHLQKQITAAQRTAIAARPRAAYRPSLDRQQPAQPRHRLRQNCPRAWCVGRRADQRPGEVALGLATGLGRGQAGAPGLGGCGVSGAVTRSGTPTTAPPESPGR